MIHHIACEMFTDHSLISIREGLEAIGMLYSVSPSFPQNFMPSSLHRSFKIHSVVASTVQGFASAIVALDP